MSLDKKLEKNVLIQLLKTFSLDEWREFEKFADSTYFNQGRNYIPLIKILKEFYPDFKSDKLTKENIYKRLYKDKQYKESVLNSMISRLYSIGEEYILQKALTKYDYMFKETLTLKELSARGLKSKAVKLIADQELLFKQRKSFEDIFLNHKIFKREETLFVYNNDKRELMYDSILDTLKFIIYSFLVELSANDVSMYTQKNFWKSDYRESYVYRLMDCIDFEAMMKLIRKNDPQNYPLIQICHLLRCCLKFPDNDEYYKTLKESVFTHFEKMENEFKKSMLHMLASICTTKFVNGKKEFKYEAFEINKKVVKEDLFPLTSSNYIKSSVFRSIFLDSMGLKETDWAENFWKKYISRLHPDLQVDVRSYCEAIVAYEKGDYSAAIDFATKVNINQITFKLDMKNLLSKIYYDTGSIEPLYSLLNTYYQLVKNSESRNDGFLSRHLRFVKYFRNLLNIKVNNSDKIELMMLKDKVMDENVTAKYWLLSKIEESSK